MPCPGRHPRLGNLIGVVLLACAALTAGCGNPEAPKIENVRLLYWDSVDDGVGKGQGQDPGWVRLEEGDVATQSPVRLEGTISDNTAVVNPKITWIGERDIDAEVWGFQECSNGTDDFFECKMQCEGPEEGYYECTPALEARKLMRGDRFLLTGTQADGETFELEVSVSEAQDIDVPESEDIPARIAWDYRIIRVSSLEGDPGVIWAVYQRTDCRTWDGELEGGCEVDAQSSALHALQSGDSLCWRPAAQEQSCSFQIALKEENNGIVIDSVDATWQSLVKWNNQSFLNWDASTGLFEEEFQLFDPRVSESTSFPEGAPTYRFVVSAEDVPDQKTGEFRVSEALVSFPFSPLTQQALPPPPPEVELPPPDLELDGEDEGSIETDNPGDNLGGTVESFSGEVRSLLYILSGLSEDPKITETRRFFYLDPQFISLGGQYSAPIIFVSDWNGDGVVDEPLEEGWIPNFLEVAALDVQDRGSRTSLTIEFVPPTGKDSPPEFEIQELFPALDEDGEGLLPYGATMRLRARAADDRGQPDFSAWECTCEAEEPQINVDRCACEPLTGEPANPWVFLNAGGAYPLNPWEWIQLTPPSEDPRKRIAVLRAKEKVEDPKDRAVAKFTAIGIDLEPESESGAYRFTVGVLGSQGPTVTLVNWENGDIVKFPESFVVEARVLPYVSELSRIQAFWNGEPQEPSPAYLYFDSTSGLFFWDLPATSGRAVQEGDRVCFGGVAVDGHATLYVLEFANTAEGLLLGVTLTPDEGACKASQD